VNDQSLPFCPQNELNRLVSHLEAIPVNWAFLQKAILRAAFWRKITLVWLALTIFAVLATLVVTHWPTVVYVAASALVVVAITFLSNCRLTAVTKDVALGEEYFFDNIRCISGHYENARLEECTKQTLLQTLNYYESEYHKLKKTLMH